MAQGIFLQSLKHVDAVLSHNLHQGNNRRPYSTGRILENHRSPNLYQFTVTISDPKIIETFRQFVLQHDKYGLTIDQKSTNIIETSVRSITFPDFEPPKKATSAYFNFKTPLIISSSNRWGNVDPFPYPYRIWQMLWDTWDAVISPLDDEHRDKFLEAIEEQVSTREFDLRTVELESPGAANGKIPATLGFLKFQVEDPNNLEAFLPLAKLADVWGVGGKTTRGYGYTDVNMQVP